MYVPRPSLPPVMLQVLKNWGWERPGNEARGETWEGSQSAVVMRKSCLLHFTFAKFLWRAGNIYAAYWVLISWSSTLHQEPANLTLTLAVAMSGMTLRT